MPDDGVQNSVSEASDVKPDFKVEAERLAQLPPHEYDSCRKAEAERLGVRVTTLDAEVEKRRPKSNNADGGKRTGRSINPREVEPWHDEVNGIALLDELVTAIREYVIFSSADAAAVALWVVHTHIIGGCHFTPRLFITSPDRRCGKSRLLKLLSKLVARPFNAGNISSASFFRTIEAVHPTLLADEFDSQKKENEEMRAVINNGYERGNPFVRCDPTTLEPLEFDTFAAVAIASIGRIWATVEDRSIIIRLQRKPKSEEVRSQRGRRTPSLDRLASMAARWGVGSANDIEAADPETPEALNDRAADIWTPLLAIADLAGGEWPARARHAALALSADGVIEDESLGVMLLFDLQEFLRDRTENTFSTKTLVEHLLTLEERPWPSYGKGAKPINARRLAIILRPFGVWTNPVRTGSAVAKRYQRADIERAAGQYLDILSVTGLQPAENSQKSPILSVTNSPDVTDPKPQKPLDSVGCTDVTDRTPESSPLQEKEPEPDEPPLAGEVEWTA